MNASRSPSEAPPPRMEPLARLPVFFALEGKRALVAGGSAGRGLEGGTAVGRRRRGRCLCAAAVRRNCWRSPPTAPRGPVTIHRRDLDARAILPVPRSRSAPSTTTTKPRAFAAAARAAGVPVNVIDKPEFCDFAFGAIVNRSPLVIGISTDGAAPVFAPGDPRQARSADPARLRALGGGRAALARARARHPACPFDGRRRFWQLFTAHAVQRSRTATRTKPTSTAAGRRRKAKARRVEQRLGDAGRRRARRSGIADAARGARAAIGRRDPVRRSGLAGDPRFRAPRGEEDAGRQDRLWARPASRTRSTR